MKMIRWLNNNIEESILIILSIITVIIVFLQVVMRTVFNSSLVWSEELARYLFIWLIYIGVAYGVKKNRHISVEVVTYILGRKGNWILSIIANILFLIFAILICYLSFNVTMSVNRMSPAMSIPMSLVYAAPFVGMLLTSIRIVQKLIDDRKTYKEGEVES